ncbi:MAG: hypothetical protein BRD49_03125 [Bacteroidetes bacterium SW_10_40_5]|nr:MAG: hypothetical protein BRD49_03125 [Bacteroidetes bacterium SW_10_40_5]
MNTTWKEWQNEHPGTLLLSTETGYNRNYRQTPYTGYEESKQIMFPVEARSDKIHPKEMVLGIEVNNTYKAYPFSVLEKRPSSIITDEVGGKTILIEFNPKEKSTKVLNEAVNFFTMFWFAWYTFHPNTEILK